MVNRIPGTANWADLGDELDAWGGSGRVATLWWRDDDAVEATPALTRQLALADGTPLSLAIIPGRLDERTAPALVDFIAANPSVSVLQHGWMHLNHAPSGGKKAELGPHRPTALMLDELAAGWRRLAERFGRLALPVLTPPWNRIAETLKPLLAGAGFLGLSTTGARQSRGNAALAEVNTHADLIAWTSDRGFVGTATALGRILDHLRARRSGTVDPSEPTGLLTHHLIQDAATDDFLQSLIALTRRHPAVRWVGAPEAFAAS